MTDPLRLSKLVPATPAEAFEAWTASEIMRQWLFTSADGQIVRTVTDPVVGGHYSILEHNDGQEIDHFGTYLVVERPRRLSFTLDVPKHFSESTRVDVTFAPDAAGCWVHFTQTGIDPEKTRMFWQQMLKRLADVL